MAVELLIASLFPRGVVQPRIVLSVHPLRDPVREADSALRIHTDAHRSVVAAGAGLYENGTVRGEHAVAGTVGNIRQEGHGLNLVRIELQLSERNAGVVHDAHHIAPSSHPDAELVRIQRTVLVVRQRKTGLLYNLKSRDCAGESVHQVALHPAFERIAGDGDEIPRRFSPCGATVPWHHDNAVPLPQQAVVIRLPVRMPLRLCGRCRKASHEGQARQERKRRNHNISFHHFQLQFTKFFILNASESGKGR